MDLRVIDFGRVPALRSQTLWHSIAYGVSQGAPPTLSFMVPESPYVSIGLHSNIDAVDTEACARSGLPIYRRMVGGGPVYIDDNQLFFQITIPASMAPVVRSNAVRDLLTPAVEAFRTVGVAAELDNVNEVVLGDQKICGHAAGQIGSAVIVVGNLITAFDHDTAATIAKTPNPLAAAMFRDLLGRYITAVDADREHFKRAAVTAYRRALSSEAVTGIGTGDGLTEYELGRLEEMDLKLADPDWVAGESHQPATGWRIKVKSGVWVHGNEDEHTTAVLGLVGDRIADARFSANGDDTSRFTDAIVGEAVPDAVEALRREGVRGIHIADLVEAMA